MPAELDLLGGWYRVIGARCRAEHVVTRASRIRARHGPASQSGTTASATGAARRSASRRSGMSRSSSRPASSSRHQKRTGAGAAAMASAGALRRHRSAPHHARHDRGGAFGTVVGPQRRVGPRPRADTVDRQRWAVDDGLAHPLGHASPAVPRAAPARPPRRQRTAPAPSAPPPPALDHRVVARLRHGHLAAPHQLRQIRPVALHRAAGGRSAASTEGRGRQLCPPTSSQGAAA